jgi:type VI secretion system protein ImpJ
MMDIHRPLFWHQGLFLQPQHFQLLDLQSRSLLAPFWEFGAPHFWGVGETEIQKTALENRTLNPLRGEFLFPDGTHAVFPGNALLEARSFDEGWIEGGKPLNVFIGLKKWNQGGENVTVLPKFENLTQVSTRFAASLEPEEVKDLHAGGPSGQIKRLHYVLKIFWESETPELGDYLLIPLAQLERSGSVIRLSENFIPPCLAIAASGPLLKIVTEIRDQITARGRNLEEYKSARGIQTAEFGTRDMVYFLALRSLNRYIPLFFHYTEAARIHPWILYGVLRQIVGELSAFSDKVNAIGESKTGERMLPPYDHRDLHGCFLAAQALISQLLDEITAGPDYIIPLLYDGTYFAAALPPTVFEGRNRFYLVLKTEEDPKALLPSLGTAAKLSSREFLPLIIARALPGIGLEHLPVPPQELPRRASCLYFQIDHHHEQWGSVKKGNNLALYWDRAPEDLEAELMVVGK